MEVLGATASIITVLHLTHQISILCWDIHSSIKNAREDIIRIIDEINTLRTVLEALARLLSSEPSGTNGTPILETTTQLEKPLKECESELQSLASELRKVIPAKGRPGFKSIVWNFKEKDVALRLEHICRLKSTLQLALTLDQTTLLIESRTHALSLRATIEDDHTKRLRRSILDWLGAPSPSTILNDAQKIRTTNTGEWFLRGTIFNAWRSTGNSFLWLHGIPGSGKTVLCSSVIEELRESDKSVLYFFFDFSTESRSTVGAWLRSWIAQLLVQSRAIPSPVRALYDAHHDGFQQPSDRELLETLHELLDGYEEAYLIIDALDECSRKPELLAMIKEIAQYDMKDPHIFITSRNEADIAETLLSLCGENVEIGGDGVNEDIQEHVRNSLLKDSRLSKWPNEVQAEITTTLTQKAEGMFRWATCQLESLSGCISLRDLRRTLNSLPTTLDGTYARILVNIHPTSAGVAFRILSWLCFAFRWPTFEEMAEILAVDIDALKYDPDGKMLNPEDVLTICGSLIMRSRDSGGSLRLSHHSVGEYLLSQHTLSSGLSSYNITELGSNTMICKICLIHLQNYDDWWHGEVRKGSKLPIIRPRLIEYCLNYWMVHFNRAGQLSELCFLAQDLFLRPSSHFLDWAWLATTFNWQLHNEQPRIHQCKSANILLYYSALIGSTALIDVMIAHGADINARGGFLGTALSAATHYGDITVVEWLLKKGADVNAPAWGYGGALGGAAAWGNVDIATVLIEHGADVNQNGSDCLQSAFLFGGLEMAEILIRSGARVDSSGGGICGSPLIAAVLGGLSALDFLTNKHGVECTLRDNEGRSALHIASMGANIYVVLRLLELGMEVNDKDNKGWSAIHYAASTTTADNLRILLPYWKPEPLDLHPRWSPLHLASRNNQPEALDLLIQAGFTPNIVPTTEPEWHWSLYDIATLYQNSGLISDTGKTMHSSLQPGLKETPTPSGSNTWYCDGCAIRFIPSTSHHSWQFKCTICPDFDYCFMCHLTAQKTHPHLLALSSQGEFTGGFEVAQVL